MSEYIEALKITSPHSFHGEMKIWSYCDDARFLTRFTAFYTDSGGAGEIKVITLRPTGEHTAILSLEGIDSEEAAAKLRGKVLFARKSDAKLEPGVFFSSDLIGLSVYDDVTGELYGTLTDIMNCGAHDVYTVTKSGGGDFLVPNVGEFVKRITPPDGVYIVTIPGMVE
ncbi:ribosome maturation factor RimM [Clostridia bacterium]|nr:ribosome maturation factor RimM [Clostridia bacterium]